MGIALSARLAGITLAACTLVACGGGDDGVGDDDGGDIDGGNGNGDGGGGCTNDGVCSANACGTVYRDGCAPVDCGLCRYDGRDIDPMGSAPSMVASSTTSVAYVRDLSVAEVMIAHYDTGQWWNETVAPLMGSGGGDPMTAIAEAADGTFWVAWSESDFTVHVASKTLVANSWTVERNIGNGLRPSIAVLADGSPVLAYAGTSPSGIQLRHKTGGSWAPSMVSPDAAFALAMQARAANIVVTWRTQDQDVRVARGTVGAFTTQDVETNVPDIAVNASIGLALDATGVPHLVYSYAEDDVVLAIDRAGTWEKVRFGRAFGQGGGAAAVVGTSSVHVSWMDAFALRVGDQSGAFVTEQTVSNRCDVGPISLAFDEDRKLHLVHGCENTPGITWRMRRGDRFPDGWGASCDAVAQRLYQTACSCAPNPQQPDCCIVVETQSGTNTDCSSGQSVAEIARAVVCGDPTVPPTILDACAPAADAATCVVDDTDGTVTVPSACLP